MMVDLLYYTAPLIAVGAATSLIFSEPVVVLVAQAMFVVLEALGIGVGAVLRRRNRRAG
jgi:hypothetical protein